MSQQDTQRKSEEELVGQGCAASIELLERKAAV